MILLRYFQKKGSHFKHVTFYTKQEILITKIRKASIYLRITTKNNQNKLACSYNYVTQYSIMLR